MSEKYIYDLTRPIGGASSDPVVIVFEDASTVQTHAKVIASYAGAEPEEFIGEADGLSEALEFFGMLAFEESFESSFKLDIKKPKRFIKFETTEPQFFEMLSELETALDNLRGYFEGLNDKERVHRDTAGVLVYINAFRLFLNSSEAPTLEVPSEIPRSLFDRLGDANWSELSEQARKWVDTISKILKGFFL